MWFVNNKHVTLQTIVAHDFRYDPRNNEDWNMTAGCYKYVWLRLK